MKDRIRFYVGLTAKGKREVIRSRGIPYPAQRFRTIIGPFRTHRGADFMALHRGDNPWCHTVADAERLAARAERDAWEQEIKNHAD